MCCVAVYKQEMMKRHVLGNGRAVTNNQQFNTVVVCLASVCVYIYTGYTRSHTYSMRADTCILRTFEGSCACPLKLTLGVREMQFVHEL